MGAIERRTILRLLPAVSIFGAILGVIACFSPWVGDQTGVSLFLSYDDGFQRFIPLLIVIMAALAAVFSVLIVIYPYNLSVLLLLFFIGVGIMVLTSVFAMWSIESIRITEMVSYGFWMTYVSGALVILGASLYYAVLSRIAHSSTV